MNNCCDESIIYMNCKIDCIEDGFGCGGGGDCWI